MKTYRATSDVDESFFKLDYYVLFAIPHEVVCKHLGYVLVITNLRNNFLLVKTISIVISRIDKWKIHSLKMLHDKPCLTTCLNKIKVLIGKHFFCYFNENLGKHLTHFSLSCKNQSFVLLCKSGDWLLYGMQH